MAIREDVYAAIDSERAYQETRWNSSTTTSHGQHSYEEWFTYIEDYIAEAKHILSRGSAQDVDLPVAHILRKVTAMGVAAMEQRGAPRREGF